MRANNTAPPNISSGQKRELSTLFIAENFRAPDHLLSFGQRMDGNQLDFRMNIDEHAEDLVGKSLADAVHLVEIQHDEAKPIDALQQVLGLLARD